MVSRLPFPSRTLSWSHGSAEVWALSGAVHHLEFRLEGGRVVRPLAEAPWHGDETVTGDETVPAHLRFLGGEWPCVPFGASEADPVTHGYGTDNRWSFEDGGEGVALGIDYPDDRPIARLRRTVRGVPGEARLASTLEVTARRDCVLPVGLHPILAPGAPGEAVCVEGNWSQGETFPVVFEPGVSRLTPAARFDTTQMLPLAGGGTIPFGDLLATRTEEAFQLFGVDGVLRIVHPRSGHAVRLGWNADDFPTCLFWISSGGRARKPWNGQFRGFGVEPLDARFADKDGEGVIAGGRELRAGETWTTRYEIGVETLEVTRPDP